MKFITKYRSGFGIIDDVDGAFRFETDPFVVQRTPGLWYGVCELDGRSIAVFLNEEVSAETRADLSARRPSWLHVLVFARSAPAADWPSDRFEAESENPFEGEATAIATACVAQNQGAVASSPASCRIVVAGHGTFDLAMEFDWEFEQWEGEVTRR
jgi:hypothetical protein